MLQRLCASEQQQIRQNLLLVPAGSWQQGELQTITISTLATSWPQLNSLVRSFPFLCTHHSSLTSGSMLIFCSSWESPGLPQTLAKRHAVYGPVADFGSRFATGWDKRTPAGQNDLLTTGSVSPGLRCSSTAPYCYRPRVPRDPAPGCCARFLFTKRLAGVR